MVSKWKIQKKLVNVLSIVQIYSDLTILTTESPTAQKMKFSIMDFFSKCAGNCADLVTFTEEILNGKHHFSCANKKNKH